MPESEYFQGYVNRRMLLLTGLAGAGLGCRRKAMERTDDARQNPPKKADDAPPPPLPMKADEIEFSYAIELTGTQRVPANHPFKSGDAFKVVVGRP